PAEGVRGARRAAGLDVSPGRVAFGATSTSVALAASKQGTGSLRVTGVTSDAPWLTVVAGAVDASGLGPYTAAVDRTGLAGGPYPASIKFTLDGGGQGKNPGSVQGGGTHTAG